MSHGLTATSPTDAPLTLVTLGGAGLYAGPKRELVLGPSKPLALLIFLELAPGRSATREYLLDLLWADMEPERARAGLRQLLWQLRRLLGDGVIQGHEELTLARPLDADRDRFLGALADGDLEAAVAAYTGPFLPSFGIPGGAAFEHWADLERDRLRAAYVRSAETVVRRQLHAARFKEAQQLARRVHHEAPQSEIAWRLLLESHISGGDFVTARVEADSLERWAADEDLQLEPATRQMVGRARQAQPAAAPQDNRGLVAELTGRETEFSTITGAWDRAKSGPARRVHVSAPAGFGKTRLLQDVIVRLRAVGARVVQLRGAPGDRDVPYAFAGDLALAISQLPGAAGVAPASTSTLIALNPAISSTLSGTADAVTGDEALRNRILALTDLVLSVADDHPFVLTVDDVHWLDQQSYLVLEGLCSRLQHARVLCLTAARPDRYPGGRDATVLSLAPLTPAEVERLVTSMGTIDPGQDWSHDFAARLHAATRGSPLLMLETLRLAVDRDILSLANGEWHCLDAARLPSLLGAGEALRERVRSLPAMPTWALTLLATAGTAIPTDALVAVAGESEPLMRDALDVLDRLGLVIRSDAGWITAHDEIAAAVREAIPREQRTTAHRCIGELFAQRAAHDHNSLLRAAQHFESAGQETAVLALYRRQARLARENGDRRPYRAIAAELLGAHLDSPRVSALVGSLPLRWRLGLWNRSRVRWATAVALVGAIAMAARARVINGRDAAVQHLFIMPQRSDAAAVAMRLDEWAGRADPLRPSPRRSDATVAYLRRATNGIAALSPDHRAVVWQEDMGDSNTVDLWMAVGGRIKRLTTSARDDGVTEWLPDGRGVIGFSSRWSPAGADDYDIAVFDTATGVARQVTRGSDHDTDPHVSPDGTRVAFFRRSRTTTPMLCLTSLDGQSTVECRLVRGHPVAGVTGWSGLDEVVVNVDSAGLRRLARYDWSRDATVSLSVPDVETGVLSPDRRWLIASGRQQDAPNVRLWAIPLERPALARPISTPASLASASIWWEGEIDRSRLIDRIQLSGPLTAVPVGITTKLRVRALAAGGAEVPLRGRMSWTTTDSAVASVDSTGTLHPLSTGRVVVNVSLGGWKTAQLALEVVGAAAQPRVRESWTNDWTTRWLAIGTPLPGVVLGPGNVRAFHNNGDGSYASQAVLRSAFTARDGLGVEVQLSTPLSHSTMQAAKVELVPGVDTLALRGWDNRGRSPALGNVDKMCAARFPAADGTFGATRMVVDGAGERQFDLGSVAGSMRSGTWWVLRLQILPDGRCGVAVNGRPVWLSRESIDLEGDFRVRLGESSYDAKILHGPLVLWTGVRADIDWSKAPR